MRSDLSKTRCFLKNIEENQKSPIAYTFDPEKIVRYDQRPFTNELFPAAEGEWVLFADYEKLLALYKQNGAK